MLEYCLVIGGISTRIPKTQTVPTNIKKTKTNSVSQDAQMAIVVFLPTAFLIFLVLIIELVFSVLSVSMVILNRLLADNLPNVFQTPIVETDRLFCGYFSYFSQAVLLTS